MISGELRHEGRARACILYIDPPPTSCSHAQGKPGHPAWTLGPQGLRGRPGCPPNTPRVLPALSEPLSCANLSLESVSCLACSYLPQFTLCSPSPQGSEFVPYMAPGWRMEPRVTPSLCPPEKRVVSGEGRILLGSCSLSQVPMPTSPILALTGGRQAALFGVSCSPLPLTLLGRKGECQSLGARGL